MLSLFPVSILQIAEDCHRGISQNIRVGYPPLLLSDHGDHSTGRNKMHYKKFPCEGCENLHRELFLICRPFAGVLPD